MLPLVTLAIVVIFISATHIPIYISRPLKWIILNIKIYTDPIDSLIVLNSFIKIFEVNLSCNLYMP